LEITNAINSNLSIEQLIKIFSFILKEQLGFSKFVLFLYQEDWQVLAKSGYKGKIDSFYPNLIVEII
jgi:sigma-B regulation protein RsbU (phosphoserine phosphatase)